MKTSFHKNDENIIRIDKQRVFTILQRIINRQNTERATKKDEIIFVSLCYKLVDLIDDDITYRSN